MLIPSAIAQNTSLENIPLLTEHASGDSLKKFENMWAIGAASLSFRLSS